jgi:hypothetical protein
VRDLSHVAYRIRIFRDAVDPLRCAVRAPRKPGVAIHGHPFDACVSPLEPAGKPFCAFAILRRTESRWFADPWQTPLGVYASPKVCTPRSCVSGRARAKQALAS